jgi:hypothetical protein
MHGSQMIYATWVSSQPGKYNSERRRHLAAVLGLLTAFAALVHSAPMWRDAPELLPLFAPAGPRGTAYNMRVTEDSLDAVLRQLDGDPALLRTPGAWNVRELAPTDAFGTAGAYNRSQLARLYGAERARVSRGARTENGRALESWTLISPYPNPTLRRLERGTLLIVLRLP